MQAWDRYAYVNNNPLKYTDPSGHFGFLATIALGAAIGAIVGGVTYAVTNQGESFDLGECAVAAGVGAAAGALIGSGIGLIAGAVTTSATATAAVGATTAAVASASSTSTALISAGTSIAVAGESYMIQNRGEFENGSFAVTTAVAGVTGAVSPRLGFANRVALDGVGAAITYSFASDDPTLEGMVNAGVYGVAGGVFDGILQAGIPEFMDTFVRICPGPVARTVARTADGMVANAGGNAAYILAQRLANQEK